MGTARILYLTYFSAYFILVGGFSLLSGLYFYKNRNELVLRIRGWKAVLLLQLNFGIIVTANCTFSIFFGIETSNAYYLFELLIAICISNNFCIGSWRMLDLDAKYRVYRNVTKQVNDIYNNSLELDSILTNNSRNDSVKNRKQILKVNTSICGREWTSQFWECLFVTFSIVSIIVFISLASVLGSSFVVIRVTPVFFAIHLVFQIFLGTKLFTSPRDVFGFRDELIWLPAVQFVAVLWLYLFRVGFSYGEINSYYYLMLVKLPGIFAVTFIVYFSACRPLLIQRNISFTTPALIELSETNKQVINSIVQTEECMFASIPINDTWFDRVITKPKFLTAFTKHLNGEFCTENMLFFLRVQQFNNTFKTESSKELEKMRTEVKDIYKLYIKDGSRFQVNLSFNVKNNIKFVFNDQFYPFGIFNDASNEVKQLLMGDTFNRFLHSKQFLNLKNTFKEEEKKSHVIVAIDAFARRSTNLQTK